MIVVMQSSATGEHIQAVIEQMVELGFNVHRTSGAGQMILAGVGTPDQFDVTEFQVMSGVQDAYRISSPYKLADRGFRPEGKFSSPRSRSRLRARSFCAVARTSRALRRTAFRAWVWRV